MYLHKCTHIYTFTDTPIYLYIYAPMYLYTYIPIYLCTHIYIYTRICISIGISYTLAGVWDVEPEILGQQALFRISIFTSIHSSHTWPACSCAGIKQDVI